MSFVSASSELRHDEVLKKFTCISAKLHGAARRGTSRAAKIPNVSLGRDSRALRCGVGLLARSTRVVVVGIGGRGRVGSGSEHAAVQPLGEVAQQGGQRLVAGRRAAQAPLRSYP